MDGQQGFVANADEISPTTMIEHPANFILREGANENLGLFDIMDFCCWSLIQIFFLFQIVPRKLQISCDCQHYCQCGNH